MKKKHIEIDFVVHAEDDAKRHFRKGAPKFRKRVAAKKSTTTNTITHSGGKTSKKNKKSYVMRTQNSKKSYVMHSPNSKKSHPSSVVQKSAERMTKSKTAPTGDIKISKRSNTGVLSSPTSLPRARRRCITDPVFRQISLLRDLCRKKRSVEDDDVDEEVCF